MNCEAFFWSSLWGHWSPRTQPSLQSTAQLTSGMTDRKGLCSFDDNLKRSRQSIHKPIDMFLGMRGHYAHA